MPAPRLCSIEGCERVLGLILNRPEMRETSCICYRQAIKVRQGKADQGMPGTSGLGRSENMLRNDGEVLSGSGCSSTSSTLARCKKRRLG